MIGHEENQEEVTFKVTDRREADPPSFALGVPVAAAAAGGAAEVPASAAKASWERTEAKIREVRKEARMADSW